MCGANALALPFTLSPLLKSNLFICVGGTYTSLALLPQYALARKKPKPSVITSRMPSTMSSTCVSSTLSAMPKTSFISTYGSSKPGERNICMSLGVRVGLPVFFRCTGNTLPKKTFSISCISSARFLLPGTILYCRAKSLSGLIVIDAIASCSCFNVIISFMIKLLIKK